MSSTLLELTGVRKSYKGTEALRGIDLDVHDNEIFALLGPTGAGKSSTVLASAGLIDLDAGQVRLGGQEVTDIEPASRDVSIVFEGFNLLPVLSVYDNIAFALRSPSFRESESEIKKRVTHTAELLRIAHQLDRDVDTLSGGEKQRVAIARALVRKPRIFLFDEPLSALDLKLREGLRSELRQIHRQHKTTMLYATHDYHGAIAIADRIGVIHGGRIQQAGTIDELYDMPANRVVGELIGSPSMAFFDVEVQGDTLNIMGCQQQFSLSDFHCSPSESRQLTLGVWPEDIHLVNNDAAGSNRGKIYAVDNRGYESAIQVETPNGSFRKVVEQGVTLHQGEACAFAISAGSGFLFDKSTGNRISHVNRSEH